MNKKERDWEVFSRQQLVIGEYGLKALLNSSLCIVGLDGLAAELAKNSLLAGVSKLILCDDQTISRADISTSVSSSYCYVIILLIYVKRYA